MLFCQFLTLSRTMQILVFPVPSYALQRLLKVTNICFHMKPLLAKILITFKMQVCTMHNAHTYHYMHMHIVFVLHTLRWLKDYRSKNSSKNSSKKFVKKFVKKFIKKIVKQFFKKIHHSL